MARTPLSGTQHTLRAGVYEAIIASVGASLRSLTFDGRDLVVPFDADEVRPSYRGATLAPWPNRVVDGIYTFGGVERKVALTEPARHHALHGLAGWLDFQATDKGPSHVTLAATIEPQTGYPWRVTVDDDLLARCRRSDPVGARDQREPGCRSVGHRAAPVPGGRRGTCRRLDARTARRRGARRHGRSPHPDRGCARSTPTMPSASTSASRVAIEQIELDHAYTGIVRDAADRGRARDGPHALSTRR